MLKLSTKVLNVGIGLSDYKDIKEGDTIEILGEVEV